MNPNKNAPKPQNIACPTYVEANLKAYSDSELGFWGRMVVERHLSQCSVCREEVDALRRIAKNMREMERATPRPELRAMILANLPNTPPSRTPARTRRTVFAPRFAMASALLLVFGVGSVFALKGTMWLHPQNKETQENPSVPNVFAPTKPKPEARKAEKPETTAVLLPDDPEGINRKASEIFARKMEQLSHEAPIATKGAEVQAYPSVPTTPKVQFIPTAKEAQQFNPFEHLRGLVQSMGGNVDHKDKLQRIENGASGTVVGNASEERAETVYVVRIPSSKVSEFFKTMGNRGALQNATLEQPKGIPGQVSRDNPHPNLPNTTQKGEKKPLILQADAEGFVTLHFVIKPMEPRLLKPKAP